MIAYDRADRFFLVLVPLIIAFMLLLPGESPVDPRPPSSSVGPPSCLTGNLPLAREPFASLPAPYSYIPPARMFGLFDSWGTISSGINGESGLIGWTWPVADTDFMLPCGAHEVAHLPGDRRDTYILAYTGFIFGSGYFESWQHGQARFVFMHLDALYYSTGARVRGGAGVGVTGWPTLPQYGNGVTGASNAHLCTIYNQAGKDWWYTIAHRPPPPKPFPQRAWNAWTHKHHKHPIPFLYRGKRSLIARAWISHQRLAGGVVAAFQYHAPRHKIPYSTQRFQGALIVVWPSRPQWVRIVRQRYIR